MEFGKKKLLKLGIVVVFLVLLVLSVQISAAKPPKLDTVGIPSTLEIPGIEGSGREDTILVVAFEHQIMVPYDPSSGLPTGKRVHTPIVITKMLDKASPGLHKALIGGEYLDEVTIKFYRKADSDEGKKEEHYFTIKLEDAIIVDIRQYQPNILDPQFKSYGHMEDVSFTYKKITWIWEPDGIETEDNWAIRH